MPIAQYGQAKVCERKLKADALEAAETNEERRTIQENWIFDDYCMEDYM